MGASLSPERVGRPAVTAALVDTDVLIDAAGGVGAAVAAIGRIEEAATLSISTITQMELLVGCRNKTELQNTESFLQRFDIVRIDAAISDTAVDLLRRYRLSHGLLIPDALIAATAQASEMSLLTKNQRDFRFVEGLLLLPYPSGV
jgi:predicted nucleic acid-binding protein